MPIKKSQDQVEPVSAVACIHLRSKAMYVTGDPKNPDDPDLDGNQYCWCNLTQHVIGPDGGRVARSACVSGRSCCEQAG